MDSNNKFYFVYIIQCSDKKKTYYTGFTTNIDNRIENHNSGKGAKYTHGRGPVKLVYLEEWFDISSALIRECQIKKLTRKQKEVLIKDYIFIV